MKSKFRDWVIRYKYLLLIVLTVLIFFNPVFQGHVPFPGDLLVSENPYRESSYIGYNPGSIPNKAQGADVIKEIYPWRFFSIESLKGGQIPFWNPYNFSGNLQLANFQTAIFYPLNFFYFILPFNISWTILIMLQPILGGIFMYFFLKELKLTSFSSFIGSLAFAFSSYMTVWIEYGNIGHTILWLPLILLFVKRLSDKISPKNFLLLNLSLLFSFLGGYIQGLFYIYLISLLYFVYLSKLKDFKKLFFIFLSFILPVLMGAFQLLPTLELFNQSTRGNYSLEQFSNLLLPVQSLLTIFAADFFGNPASRNYFLPGTYIERVVYIGIPILFFAIYSFRRRTGEWHFFAFVSAASILVATNFPFIKYLYQIPIPVISTAVPTRELSIFIFSSIVLSSFGINYWEKTKQKSIFPYLFIFIYVLLWLGIFISLKFGVINNENFKIMARNLILPGLLAILTFIVFYLKNNLGRTLLVIIVVADLFYFFHKITPFSPSALIYPQTPLVSFLQKNAGINRYWGYGSAYIYPNFQTVDRTFSPEGNDPLHISSYGKLLASSYNGEIPQILPRPDANIAPGYGQEDLKNNFYRKRILDLLGVKYIVHKSQTVDLDTFPKESYSLIWMDGVLQIYENKNSFPRFFMANEYIVTRDRNETLKNIYDKNIDLRKTIILDEKPSIKIDKTSENAVSLISYSPNKIIFQTKSTGNSLLFLSDNHYPEWMARIDGRDTKLLLANYSLRSIAIPKGNHVVTLNYLPKSFILGYKISLAGLAGFFGILFLIKKYEKK